MQRLLALGAAIASLMPLSAWAQAKQDFTLVNRTGYTIDEVYVAPSRSNDWGSDVMGKDVLENRQSVDISFAPRARTCVWDLKVAYSDQSTSEWEKFNLCETSKIILRYNKSTGETWAEYE